MKIIKILILSVFIALSGCMDLEEKPESFVSPSNFYTSSTQINAIYTGAMNSIWDLWNNRGYSYGWIVFIFDDQLITGSDPGLNVSYNSHAADVWAGHYQALLNINNALSALKSGKVKDATDKEINTLTGLGKFLRAWNYFQLVRIWGGVPLYLEDDDPSNVPEARATVAEVYESIVADLTYAALNLPSTWTDGSNGKPTISAANAILAKVYLTMATAPLNQTENYALARDAAKKVMDDPNYSLIHSIYDVFLMENKYGPETIWGFNSTTDDQATPSKIWGVGEGDYVGWGDTYVDMQWDSLFVQQPRKDAYIIDTVDGKYYIDWINGPRPMAAKYLPPNVSWEEHESGGEYGGSNNVPIIRYADVLLIFAEAENMASGGPTTAAVEAINKVRDRANGYVVNPNYPLLTTAMSKEAFDDAVIQERNLELCFEYDRWFDICRKRLLEKLILPGQPLFKYQADFSIYDYLFPIPEADMRLNELLEQNDGYAEP